ncbi:MAG TPA: hypothetical protein VL576_00890 [Candidatus Paceibacterota bacterium]|jgi:hypothetical protein|nr:hypothetical protein [Candidatus Paceibacterota bacterium]
MKTIALIVCMAFSYIVSAQTRDTTKKSTWMQRNVLPYAAPDSVSKTDSTVTMYFKKKGTRVTVSHADYIGYMKISNYFAEEALEMRSRELKQATWPSSQRIQQGSGPSGN